MKYYLIAGESSGDLHGSNLMKALKERDAQAEFRCWGGDKMEAVAGKVVKHIKELAFMGFWEVIINLRTILRNIDFCKQDILEYQPDVVILIDYPGFNFRLFEFLKEHNFRIFYYISPQVWAWKTSRVHKIKKYVERMFVIFPFEKAFYKKYGIEVDYVGHPLLDIMPTELKSDEERTRLQTIALLPGSRKQEISRVLPEMMKAVKYWQAYKWVIAGMSIHGKEYYEQFITDKHCTVVMDDTYGVLDRSSAAIVCSGTATLETCMMRVPQIVVYKGGWLSVLIARILVTAVDYISIVNIIAGKMIVRELIQKDFNKEALLDEMRYALHVPGRNYILKGYEEVNAQLGTAGASERAATLMLSYLGKGNKD